MLVQLTDWVDAVTTSVLSNFVELCVFNILQTDTQTVTEAIQSFNGTVQITSVISVRITWLIRYLISIVCPGQPACNGRGRCFRSTCICDTGIDDSRNACVLRTLILKMYPQYFSCNLELAFSDFNNYWQKLYMETRRP